MTIEEVECPICHTVFALDDFDEKDLDQVVDCVECEEELGCEYDAATGVLTLVELEDEELDDVAPDEVADESEDEDPEGDADDASADYE